MKTEEDRMCEGQDTSLGPSGHHLVLLPAFPGGPGQRRPGGTFPSLPVIFLMTLGS